MAMSDLEYVKGLTGPTRDIVVKAYVQSFEYTHGEQGTSMHISGSMSNH